MRRLGWWILVAGLCTACGPDRETLYQTSTLQALMVGVYDGRTTVRDVRRHGDLGLGTFSGLDGEMVVIDGVVYQVSVDGKVTAMPDSAGVPFVNVTYFETDAAHDLPSGLTFEQFPAWMDARLESLNLPYAFRIDGRFRYVRTRSVPKQSRPYPPLTQAVQEQQVFEFRDIRGTVLGFRFPVYLKGVNVEGYHLHFISADRTKGGHLLAFIADEVTAAIDVTPRFTMELHQTPAFLQARTTVHAGDVHKVEKDR